MTFRLLLTTIILLFVIVPLVAQEDELPRDGLWTVNATYADDGACGDFAGAQDTSTAELTFELVEDGNVLAIGSVETSSTEYYNRVSDGVYSSENERMTIIVTLYSPDYFVLDVMFGGDLAGCNLQIAYGDSSAVSPPPVDAVDDTNQAETMIESALIYNDYVPEPVCTVFGDEANTRPLCVQSGNILLNQINQVSEATFAMSLLPDEAAFLILNAGGGAGKFNGIWVNIFHGSDDL